jgi:hypothetical protein
VADEAEHNPEFRRRLEEALRLSSDRIEERFARPGVSRPSAFREADGRPKNRRSAAVLNPIEVASEGEEQLRKRLAALTLDQLRDVVADYGMDPGRLVMKWKSAERVVNRIVELSMSRARKGDAFRSST